MINYDKYKIKNALNIEQIFNILNDFGGNPTYNGNHIISDTICHNVPGEGSHKLYYYLNENESGIFHCYTGCENSTFDIFELVVKVFRIQYNEEFDLNDAVRWVAQRFGISGEYLEQDEHDKLEDWQILSNYDRIKEIELNSQQIVLKEYDQNLLNRFNYQVKIRPWLNEGISQEVLEKAKIGFFPGGDQITIPHFDVDNRLIGIRGRALSQEEAEVYGKYRPLKVNTNWYNHPLGLNLYGLNWNKNNIKLFKKAIITEGEKSVLLYASYFGWQNNICVACCGSSISNYQIELLKRAGAEEIIIALDRQFQEIGDDEFKKLKKNLLNIRNKYKNDILISFIFDKNKITSYKASPLDEGQEKFLQLYKERIIL